MSVVYRLVQDEEGNQSHVLKIDGTVRTCFSTQGSSVHKEEYDLWLGEGNTPEPAE